MFIKWGRWTTTECLSFGNIGLPGVVYTGPDFWTYAVLESEGASSWDVPVFISELFDNLEVLPGIYKQFEVDYTCIGEAASIIN